MCLTVCAGRGSRQAEKARREAELEVEAAGRKLEALEVVTFAILLIFSFICLIILIIILVLILIITKIIQEQLCRVQSKLRLSKQQAEDSELLVSASQARFLSHDVVQMMCLI